jgi:hypothetical protein
MTISQVDETYTLTIPSVTNQPDNVNSENDVLTVQVKFLVANEPVIFSGRSFEIESTVHYPGGFVSQTATLSVVGPLVKPLLQLAKSFQVTYGLHVSDACFSCQNKANFLKLYFRFWIPVWTHQVAYFM